MYKLLAAYRYVSRLIGKKPFLWKLAFVMNAFQNLFANVFIGFSIQMIIDGINNNNEDLLNKGVILLFVGAAYLIIGLPILCYLLDSTNAKMKMILETKVFDKIVKRDYEAAISSDSSEIVSVLQNDIPEVSGLFGWNFVVFFQAVLSGIGCLVLLLNVNIWLALAVVLFSVSLLFLNKFFSKSLYESANKMRDLYFKRINMITSVLDNSTVLRIYSMMNLQCQSLSKIGQEKADTEFSMRQKLNFKTVIETLITDICITAAVVILGSFLVFQEQISIGKLFLAIELKNGVVFFFSYIGGYINDLQSAIVSSEHIAELEDTFKEQTENKELRTLKHLEHIEFKHVTYRYPGASSDVFSNLSFQTNKRKICLIGENGKGKSTIIKLIAGYLKKYTGEILADGVDMRSLNMNKMVSIVPQDSIIINDTILNNIIFGRTVEKDVAVEAAKKAGIYHEIMKMEKGFDSVLLEDGANISAGQRKRIALARAFLVNAPIIILDEFSANIDEATANKLLEHLFENSGDKMIIAITHECNIVSRFDEVIDF